MPGVWRAERGSRALGNHCGVCGDEVRRARRWVKAVFARETARLAGAAPMGFRRVAAGEPARKTFACRVAAPLTGRTVAIVHSGERRLLITAGKGIAPMKRLRTEEVQAVEELEGNPSN